MSDMEIGTVLFESLIVELLPIVGNKCMGKSNQQIMNFQKNFLILA